MLKPSSWGLDIAQNPVSSVAVLLVVRELQRSEKSRQNLGAIANLQCVCANAAHITMFQTLSAKLQDFCLGIKTLKLKTLRQSSKPSAKFNLKTTTLGL